MQDYEKLGVFYLGREFDAARGAATDDLLLYDSRDLTTHAVCVGMTGSGKTGLCLALLEEAAIDGVPAICIDPKGDLADLLLTFPDLAPADFAPWVDGAEAARKGVSVEDFAAQTAAAWKKGLEEWGQPVERVARFRNAVDLAIYTPGANTGLPLSVLRSFSAPSEAVLNDATALRDRVATVVSGLLTLLGREADPIKSREHILLSNVIEHAWRDGSSLDLVALIGAIQKPAFDKVGAFDLETFLPAKVRLELAMAVNNLLASPGFAAWTEGEPLDAQRLLFTAEGKPRVSIISIAHLDDTQRMFIVTLVLNELISWMRAQSGTSSLRAIFYMDEIFGYFPPTASPPSKPPMLTLLKQGRAFGLGCVLATQNPVDLDYKGLSNAGTWMIGRLQTGRDKMRVIEGLESALSGSGTYDRAALDKMMSALTQRVFLMRNVHDDAPVLFQSRWALSYLRGPLTGPEISRLMAPRKAATAAQSGVAQEPLSSARDTASSSVTRSSPAQPPSATGTRSPAGATEYFLPATQGTGPITYKPMVMALAKLHFIDAKLALDQWRTNAYLAPFSDDATEIPWAEAKLIPDLKSHLTTTPSNEATFAPLPAPAMRAASFPAWGKSLAAWLYESARAEVLICDALKATSAPGEPEGEFRSRLALAARERRDSAVEELRRKYAPRIQTLDDRERRAQQRVASEQSQLTQQKFQTALTIGASILGAFMGRKALSATNINRAATAARSATRIGRESGDVDRADDNLDVIRQQRADLQRQFEADSTALERTLDLSAVSFRSAQVAARKSDIAVGEVALVWAPWRTGADGFPAPAFD
ncbi:MAG: ATP-binding protein [Gammaproteobacteria bacterium]